MHNDFFLNNNLKIRLKLKDFDTDVASDYPMTWVCVEVSIKHLKNIDNILNKLNKDLKKFDEKLFAEYLTWD